MNLYLHSARGPAQSGEEGRPLMRDSKHWPLRTLRRTYLALFAAGAAVVLAAAPALASPNPMIWH